MGGGSRFLPRYPWRSKWTSITNPPRFRLQCCDTLHQLRPSPGWIVAGPPKAAPDIVGVLVHIPSLPHRALTLVE